MAENKQEVRIELSLSKNHTSLIVTEHKFNEFGFADSTKRGVVAINPDYDPDELLEKAKEMEWQIVGEPDTGGFYKAKGKPKKVA